MSSGAWSLAPGFWCLFSIFHFDFGRFRSEVVEHDGGEDHSGDAHQFLAEDQPEQRQPDRAADASADDFAVEEVFEFVNYNQKHQGDQGHPGRKGEANADHQAVADQISDHRDQAAKESYADDHDGIREARNHDKNGGEHGVDGRDADLRAHHHGETGVESTEAFRNLLAASQVEIVGHGASFAVEFELRMEEKADGHDATHDEQHEFSGCAAGEIGEAANVLRLAPSGVHGEIFEAVVIG